jgi:hypothetical protein
MEHVVDALLNMPVTEQEELDIAPDFIAALRHDAAEVEKDILTLTGQLPELNRQLEDLWKDIHDCEYELVAVFMHRGRYYSRALVVH